MKYPDNIKIYNKKELKLGIKSSLPNVKSTLALILLIWESSNQPAEIVYSTQENNRIIMDKQIQQNIVDLVQKKCDITIDSSEDLINKLNENQLFNSQLEALKVALELIWKLAEVNFVESNKATSAERTGGNRFSKKLIFTVNLDIIHCLLKNDFKEYIKVILGWIGIEIQYKSVYEENLINILNILSENAVFKLETEDKSIVFNQNSIYEKILETRDVIDISGKKEAKGSLRILKSALSENMNPFLKYSQGNVSVNDDKNNDLIQYQKRLETYFTLSAIQIVQNENSDNKKNNSAIEVTNILLYGVPGCGKSYYVKQHYENEITNDQCKIRVVFHPDYTYSDFVGQIMPVVEKVIKEGSNGELEEKLKYKFVPGPFTRILKVANENKNEKCLLIIEELNRGNAPAIFGEVFQLLDRDDAGFSKYAIYNSDIANEVYDDAMRPVKLPPNLTIVATMNTSDQNVFTMDTAFQRRWQMKHIPNRFTGDSLDEAIRKHVAQPIPGSKISWGAFATVVNSKMGKAALGMAGTEDKSLGVYFATDKDLEKKEIFAEKVLKYLWDDAFRLARSELFKDYDRSLAHIIETFEDATDDPLQSVLQKEVYEGMQAKQPEFVLKDKNAASAGDTSNEDSSGDAE